MRLNFRLPLVAALLLITAAWARPTATVTSDECNEGAVLAICSGILNCTQCDGLTGDAKLECEDACVCTWLSCANAFGCAEGCTPSGGE